MPKLTKTLVDKARPAEKDVFLWDSHLTGFGLKVQPNGVKSFVFQYRPAHGRNKRRIKIGNLSDALTVDQARHKAVKLRRKVDDGLDPLGERKAARNALTVAALLGLYLESEKFASKAESTRRIDQGRIKRHLLPTLGSKYVGHYSAEDGRRAFSMIRNGKTAGEERTGPRGRAIFKGGEGTARMALRLFKAVERWAVEEGYASTCPCASVKLGTDGTRDVILENSDQYAALFRTIDRLETERRLRSPVADAIRVIALTGARRSEIAGLVWRYVDLKKGVIELPPARHKTGAKTGASRIIGLPAAAQAIIARQPEGEPDDYVFMPAKGEGAIALAKPWREIRKAAELPDGIGLHGLRHSLASTMAMNGAQATEIMAAMGHRQLTTAQRYVHWAQDSRAALAEKAAAHISDALTGKGKKAKVVPLDERAKR